MVHFEFGQERLTEPHPLNTVELAQGAIQRCFRPIFKDPARARWVRFAKSLFVAALAGVV